jgi:hypothetical protein
LSKTSGGAVAARVKTFLHSRIKQASLEAAGEERKMDLIDDTIDHK